MVVRLFHVWEKRLVAVINRLPIVTIGLKRFANGCHDHCSAFLIGGTRCPPVCPAEVWSQMSVWFCHGSDSFLAVTFMQPADSAGLKEPLNRSDIVMATIRCR